ncbi:MAG: imidazole glycerol phosphate synthase subunit HisH [Candidatus Omnitrophica bacterium]|nr:imidazole glycerol phosphate synthase subunit HisH [Candidatus Omnitrophota bacterium]MCA9426459.1 imidazole glycerol phosphate synthase subunit HisH [Candidatus Omnitrophota bacterium]
MILIVDYGAGNLRSVVRGLEAVQGDPLLSADPGKFQDAEGVVFPGQGSFDTAMTRLRELDLEAPLKRYLSEGRPFLGICLGLQLLFDTSEEAPSARGVGAFAGPNRRFKPGKKVPHLGWNSVEWKKESPFFEGIPSGSFFYFVHSYYPVPENKEIVAGVSDYEEEFCCAVSKGNQAAVQFHPEKSQKAGLKLLSNFVKICKDNH